MKQRLDRMQRRRDVAQAFVAPRLLRRLRIFALIIAIIFGVVSYRAIQGTSGFSSPSAAWSAER